LPVKFSVPALRDSEHSALEIPYPALDHISRCTLEAVGQLCFHLQIISHSPFSRHGLFTDCTLWAPRNDGATKEFINPTATQTDSFRPAQLAGSARLAGCQPGSVLANWHQTEQQARACPTNKGQPWCEPDR